MSDESCTALTQSASNDHNALFTPSCVCPACAPPEFNEPSDEGETMWLPVDGRSRRFDVENMDLGSTGHDLLG